VIENDLQHRLTTENRRSYSTCGKIVGQHYSCGRRSRQRIPAVAGRKATASTFVWGDKRRRGFPGAAYFVLMAAIAGRVVGNFHVLIGVTRNGIVNKAAAVIFGDNSNRSVTTNVA
jgi:hypothetical protein